MMMLSALLSASGSAYMSPWRRLDWMPAASSLTRASAQHFGRAVDADRLAGARAEQLDHPAGAGADVDQAAERRLPSAASIARSTSLSATWSERIWSHTSAWPAK